MDTGEYLNVPVSIKEIEFLIDNFSPKNSKSRFFQC